MSIIRENIEDIRSIDANVSGISGLLNTSVLRNGLETSGLISTTGNNLISFADGIKLTYTDGIGNPNKIETTLSLPNLDIGTGNENSKVFILKEFGLNPSVSASALLYGQTRPTGHVGAYLNTKDRVVYDATDTKTNLIAIGESSIDGQGNWFDIVEYESGASYFNDVYANTIYANNLFGQGQSWVDVTSERALSVIYTNTTGRPIFISIAQITASSGSSYQFKVDGVTVARLQHSSVNVGGEIYCIVPNGSTYELTGSFAFQLWFELI